MDDQPESIKKARSNTRVSLQCAIVLANGIQVGEGRVLDLSGRGCLVESSVLAKAGDTVQLRITLPEPEPSMRVPQAVVRWTQEGRFGVEFVGMEAKDRLRLICLLTRHGDPWSRSHD